MLEYVGNLWRAKLDNSTKMMHYKLTEIHAEILQDNLVELNLDFNLISVIPLEIGRLKKLEDFSIIKNRLTFLPDALFDLKQLRSIKVDDNKIAEIPRAIIRLSRSLETLVSISVVPFIVHKCIYFT